jgi:transposase
MSKTAVGIDISKVKFDVALILPNKKFKHSKFDNNPQGFLKFITWLNAFELPHIHIAMEATGIYGDALACFLYDKGFIVSVVNPLRIKKYADENLQRTKNDKHDSKTIASFCLEKTLSPWQPAPAHVRELQALIRRLESLQNMLGQENNRLESLNSAVHDSIKTIISSLESEIVSIKLRIKQLIDNDPDLRNKKKLLETIPGIGESTIAQILGFIQIENFSSSKKLTAFIGLNPQERSSGTSLRGYIGLSKKGNSRLRKAFYMPAIVALRFNPIVNTFCERLKTNGKAKMCALGAAMRKLVCIVFGVLKSGLPFDPALAVNNA